LGKDVKTTAIWAVRLRDRDASGAAALRQIAKIEICERAPYVWLCGESMNERLELALRKLAGAERFSVLADGQLRRAGRRVPQGTLPEGEWLALSQWATLEVQPPAFAGDLSARSIIRLVRSFEESEASGLVTDLTTWTNYATAAPEVRLRPLWFAMAADGRVLIRGTPLPPLPGIRYAARDGIALPCGYALWPNLEPAVFVELLELARSDLALFSPDGSFERIAATHFVQATRSAVRATQEATK
jgi:MoxR-vWA-beta-propeller ternary system domain bpX2